MGKYELESAAVTLWHTVQPRFGDVLESSPSVRAAWQQAWSALLSDVATLMHGYGFGVDSGGSGLVISFDGRELVMSPRQDGSLSALWRNDGENRFTLLERDQLIYLAHRDAFKGALMDRNPVDVLVEAILDKFDLASTS